MKMPEENTILVAGACAGMIRPTLRALAEAGKGLALVARDRAALEALREDLRSRSPAPNRIAILAADCASPGAPAKAIEAVQKALGPIDGLLCAFGSMPEQSAIEASPELAAEVAAANFAGPMTWALAAAGAMEASVAAGAIKGGFIAAVSSVAGDRARAKSAVYGASKAGLSAFLEALAGRLAGGPLRVVDIRPGPIDTPMTASMQKGGLFSTPEKITAGLLAALAAKGPKTVAYLPGFWRVLMGILTRLPWALFRRLPI